MEVQKGDIVLSLNGRDKGRALFVLDLEGEYVLLADGKSRRTEHPKRKKKKHCMFLARIESRTAEKLRNGDKVGNSEVRKTLATFCAGAADAQPLTGGG